MSLWTIKMPISFLNITVLIIFCLTFCNGASLAPNGHTSARIKRESGPPVGRVPAPRSPLPTMIPTTSATFSSVTRKPTTSRPRAENRERIEGQEQTDVVDSTLALIESGDAGTSLPPDVKDIILVSGMTGAGKSTITKFIATDNSDMESYYKDSRFLIRDVEGKISEGSTIVSRTIYPDLFRDYRSGVAFYDLPGFKDTRNESLDIANSYFIKKVADHASRVKILCIVSYSFLRPGEDRNSIIQLLSHLSSMIPRAAKFHSSIGLIASKVESEKSIEEVVEGIADFLYEVKEGLDNIEMEEGKRRNYFAILDALLQQDPETGEYTRIGFLRQPDRAGRLSQLPLVQSVKPMLEKLVYRSLTYTSKEPNDFGLSISTEAKIVAGKILERIHEQILQTSEGIANEFKNRTRDQIDFSRDLCGTLVELKQDLLTFKNITTAFQGNLRRDRVLQLLEHLAISLNLTFSDQKDSGNGTATTSLVSTTAGKRYAELGRKLKFFERASGEFLRQSTRRWTQPLLQAQREVIQLIREGGQKLSAAVTAQTISLKTRLVLLYQRPLPEGTHVASFINSLKEDSERLVTLIEFGRIDISLGSFLNSVLEVVSHQKSMARLPSNSLVEIAHLSNSCNSFAQEYFDSLNSLLNPQRPVAQSSPLQPQMWLTPLEQVVDVIHQRIAQLTIQMRDEEHKQELLKHGQTIDNLTVRLKDQKAETDKIVQDLQKQARASAEKFRENVKKMTEDIEKLQAKQKKEREDWLKREEERVENEKKDKIESDKYWENRLKNVAEENAQLVKDQHAKFEKEEKERTERAEKAWEAKVAMLTKEHKNQQAELQRSLERVLASDKTPTPQQPTQPTIVEHKEEKRKLRAECLLLPFFCLTGVI